jgi:predicted alpha/beta hydrolase family esterase
MTKQIILIRGGETYDTYNEYITGLKNMVIDFDRLTEKGWKETLEEKLGSDVKVIMPKMPNSLNAKYLEWRIFFDKIVPFLNDEVIFIGNSLGAIFIPKYLSENILPKKILGIFLVGAPYDKADSKYSLADFILPKSLDQMSKQCQSIFFYYSSDDPVIPRLDMEKYRRVLPQAHYTLLDGRGHFSVPEFPEIVKDINSILPLSKSK